MKAANELGAVTALITNNPEAKIKGSVSHCIVLNTGAEILSGSTRLKAGTAQKIVLNMISTGAMVKIGKTFGNLMIDVKVSNKKLKARAINLISLIAKCDKDLAERALEVSQNKVKQAVLYIKKSLDFNTATQLLNKHSGFLSRALEDN
jgi:N-acetylmuramic acid 6-phosphate etherase